MKSSNTRRWMFISLALAVAAGGSFGVVADRLVLQEEPKSKKTQRAGGSMWFSCDEDESGGSGRDHHSKRNRRMIEGMSEDLGLSADQVVQLEQILDRHGREAREFWYRTRGEYCSQREAMRSDIRSILTEEQLPRLEQRIRRWREKRRSGSGAAPWQGDGGEHGHW